MRTGCCSARLAVNSGNYGGRVDILYGLSYGCRTLMQVLEDNRLQITTTIADGMSLRDYPDIKNKILKELYLFFFTGTFFVIMGRAGKLRKRFLARITGRSIEEADRILYTKASWQSWKNQDKCLIGKKTDYSAFRHTDMVSCVREYDVNIFFLRKGDTLIAIDAGYKSHPGLLPRCRKIGVDPAGVQALFLTHADPDHAGGLDVRQENAFQNARVYLGDREENYLTNTWHRKQIGPFGLKNSVTIADGYQLLKDGQTAQIGDFKVQAFLVPGHTLGHLCYLIDDELLFTGDSIALNKDGGWCFFDFFNYDSKMNMASLQALRKKLDLGKIRYVFTSHNGFTNDPSSAFRHIDTIPTLEKGRPFDETAPYDCFEEREE